MTIPAEELTAVKRTHEFLREIATGPRLPMRDLRRKAFDCLKHFPFEVVLDDLWADRISEWEDMLRG